MNKIDVSVYYFPNYHLDERNEKMHGKGWTEWELVKRAEPRFAGHDQPKVPLWGYEDESLPEVMEKKIEHAYLSGVDNFIFDWYWYEDGSYLSRALDKGFLGAKNNDKLKFSVMWANHDWIDIHPAQRSLHSHGVNTLMPGEVSEAAFNRAADFMIENYFCHPSYYTIDGACYLSFYMLAGLISGLGGAESAKRVLNEFRERAARRGIKLHYNAVIWGKQLLPKEKGITNVNELLDYLGFQSITSYVWVHHNEIQGFPSYDYAKYMEECRLQYQPFTDKYTLPYYPNVSVGWDPSPRTCMSDMYENLGYPFDPILVNNTPENFEKALQNARGFMQNGKADHKMITINSWNEWTEGSYLEPDKTYGYGYLDALKKVFGKQGE